MATGYAVPLSIAADLDTLAALLEAGTNISDATEVVDVPEGMNGRKAIKITGTAAADILAVVNGRQEVSTVDFGDSVSGAGTLTVDAQETVALQYDDAAADIKAALETLSTVDTVSIAGTGTVADPWVITFSDSKVHAVSITDTSFSASPTLTETTAGVAAVAIAGVQEVATITDGDASSGDFTITVDEQTTATIAAGDNAAAVRAALEALSTVGTVVVTGAGSVASPFVITFTGLAAHDVSVTDVDLVAGTPTYVRTTPGKAVENKSVIMSGTTPA